MNSEDDNPTAQPVTLDEPLAAARSPFAAAPESTIGVPPRLAGPWPRYWARHFDLTIWILLLALPIGWYAPAAFVRPMPVATYLATLPLAMLLDAIVYSLCGNTPGKSMAGIRVLDENGKAVKFATYLKRDFQLYVRGLALGIPIISIFTMISAHQKLVAQQRLSWDEKTRSRVLQLRSGRWRSWLVACLYVGISAGALYFAQKMKSPEALLRFAVAAANATGSSMIDEDTRFDRAEALPGLTIQFDFTLLTKDADDVDQEYRQAFEAEMRKPLKNTLCTSDDLKPLRDIDVTFRYRYSNRYGGLVGLISMASSECGPGSTH